MVNEFKKLLDDAVVRYLLKMCVKEQSDTITIKQLGQIITTFEKKVPTNEEVIIRPDGRVSSLECQVVYLESQDKLKARKLEDIEQNGPCGS